MFLGADIFGYTAFNANDTDIGQRIEELSPHLDYICPMVYPSGYHLGIPGVRNPVLNPYEIVKESVRLTRQRSQNPGVQVRPWLQDFKDYAFDKRIFGPGEVRAQIRGGDDGGGSGWMLWNPRNDYTGGRAPLQDLRHLQVVAVAMRAALSAVLLGITLAVAVLAGAQAPTREPNELGRVMILEYHKIDTPGAAGPAPRRTSGVTSQRLWERGYRYGGAQRLPRRQDRACPRGTTPVILTFDDSSPGQFRYARAQRQRLGDRSRVRGRHPRGLRARASGVRPRRHVLRAARAPIRPTGSSTSPSWPAASSSTWRARATRSATTRSGTPSWAATPRRWCASSSPTRRTWVQRHVPGYRFRTLALPHGQLPEGARLGRVGRGQGHDATTTTPS